MHPYSTEVRLLCKKLEEAGFIPKNTYNYDERLSLGNPNCLLGLKNLKRMRQDQANSCEYNAMLDAAITALTALQTAWWELTVSEILAVDVSHVTFYDPQDKLDFTIMVVLGNEPGIALSDWSAKLDSNAWKALERVSSEVEEELCDYA